MKGFWCWSQTFRPTVNLNVQMNVCLCLTVRRLTVLLQDQRCVKVPTSPVRVPSLVVLSPLEEA